MKKFLRVMILSLLVLSLVSGSLCCFAFELNDEAVNLHKGQYKNYLLLGDSVASGYRDQITENDREFNRANQETVYYRVPGSYADILANAIIDDGSMTAFAAPGFRTIEIRYMLEDDFSETDDYLLHPSQLDAVGYAGSEEYRTAYKKSIAEADLITLGVGGNDWGAYLTWVIADVMEKKNVTDEYMEKLQEIIDTSSMDISTIESLIEVAHIAGALPELVETVPTALEYGLSNFYKNWDIMIQDIYDLNPDVTLMVVGMSDNSVKGKYYDYEGVVGEEISGVREGDDAAAVSGAIVDLIMEIANKPMIDGAEKFGYTYVDISGTTYVDSHPDAAGHAYIANKIIEALPDAGIYSVLEDVRPGYKYYNDIEYVIKNGLMTQTSNTTFSPDDAITKGQFAYALNVINGTENDTEDNSEITAMSIAFGFLSNGFDKGFTGFFNSFALAFRVLSESGFKFNATVSRAMSANYIRTFAEI